MADAASASQATRVLYTGGYLCVEWTVGAAMGCMVGGPALLAIAQQIGTVRILEAPSEDCIASGIDPCYDTSDIGDMGLATTALAVGNLVGSAVGGPLVDRMRKWNRVIVGVVLLNGASIAAVAFVSALWQLLLASLLNGFAIGVIEPMLNVGCVRLWPPDRSGPLMQTFATTFGSGIFSSPALVALDLAATGSFHNSYMLVGALVCATAIAPIVIPSPQPRRAAKKLEAEPAEGGEDGQGEEGDEKERLVSSDSADGGGGQQGRAGARDRTELVVKGCTAFTIMCYCGAEASFGAWIPTFAVATGSTGEAGGAALASLFWGCFTLGRILGIPISLRFTPPQIVTVDLCCALAVMAALLAVGTAAPSEAVLQVCTAAFGLVMACTCAPTPEDFRVWVVHMRKLCSSSRLTAQHCRPFVRRSAGQDPAVDLRLRDRRDVHVHRDDRRLARQRLLRHDRRAALRCAQHLARALELGCTPLHAACSLHYWSTPT